MAQHKTISIDQVIFENVSLQVEDLDPVLKDVDFNLPMDQNIIVQSSNPAHAVQFLEILAGRRMPVSGQIKCSDGIETTDLISTVNQTVTSFFESDRPAPSATVNQILKSLEVKPELLTEAIDNFDWWSLLETPFRSLSYENQKLVMMVVPTLKQPQMLILEDPAVGLGEQAFLNFLDWVQRWQREGYLRHIYITNNHPTAMRHLEASVLYVEDGLIYFDDTLVFKKIVHF